MKANDRTTGRERRRRPLLLLVGAESKSRVLLARRLIDRDQGVVLCSGPPGCPLVRGDECTIRDACDAVVMLPGGPHDRASVAALAMCAQGARRALVVEPSVVPSDVGALRVRSVDEAAIALPSMLGAGQPGKE